MCSRSIIYIIIKWVINMTRAIKKLKAIGIRLGIAVILGTILGLLGMLFMKQHFFMGMYITLLVQGMVYMIVTIYYLIGSPKTRVRFFSGVDPDTKTVIKDDEREDLGAGALVPGVVAIVVIILGFAIEAMMH